MGDAVTVREAVEPSWCDIFKGSQPFVGPVASPSLVAKNPALRVLRNLRFRNPDDFQAESLHAHPVVWDKLLSGVSNEHVDFMAIINEGVKVEQFFSHFKGDFKGKSFDSVRPTLVVLENSKSCAQCLNFISTTVLQWVSAGVLSVCRSHHLIWSFPSLLSPRNLAFATTSVTLICGSKTFLSN